MRFPSNSFEKVGVDVFLLLRYTAKVSLDPRICNVTIDGNVLNREGKATDALIDRLLALADIGTINLIVPKGVRSEIEHQAAPAHKKQAALPRIFTLQVGLNPDEQRNHQLIMQALQGNAKPGKHRRDADHLFEAAKYGGYFITHDQRILNKAGQLVHVLPSSLTVVTLPEFVSIFDRFEANDALR